jgi:MoxR-like ATPase
MDWGRRCLFWEETWGPTPVFDENEVPHRLLEDIRTKPFPLRNIDGIVGMVILAACADYCPSQSDRKSVRRHVLFTGLYGTGKTEVAKRLASALRHEASTCARAEAVDNCAKAHYCRIQGHPDLMPVKLLGQSVGGTWYPGDLERAGVVLLFDEINRTPPRTQAALLELMGEGKITQEAGRELNRDRLMVLGTRNPDDHTFALPAAQLDRFLIDVWTMQPPDLVSAIGWATGEQEAANDETELRTGGEQEQRPLQADVDVSQVYGLLDALRKKVRGVPVSPMAKEAVNLVCALTWTSRAAARVAPELLDRVVSVDAGKVLVRQAVEHVLKDVDPELPDIISQGVGLRAALAMSAMASALAYACGDEEVTWKHVLAVAPSCLQHRVVGRKRGTNIEVGDGPRIADAVCQAAAKILAWKEARTASSAAPQAVSAEGA